MKNEKGVWVTPAFPKLIYVLEEDNIHEDSPYWYLTKLAAKCTATPHGAGLHLREEDACELSRADVSYTPAWAAAAS